MIRQEIVVLIVCVFGFAQCVDVEIQCTPLRNCPKLLNLLKENPIPQRTIKFLKQSHCGFEKDHPKVWCAQVVATNCTTPDGKAGKCKLIKECSPLLQLLNVWTVSSEDRMTTLEKYRCSDSNSNVNSVCCATDEESPVTQKSSDKTDSSILINPLSIGDETDKIQNNLLPNQAAGECGGQLIRKIVGGKVTEMDEFPWTALLQYQSGSRFTTACGGTLISKKYVVTAAHCADDLAIRTVGKLTNVILGEFDTRTETDCINSLGVEDCADPIVRIPVEEIILYPEWYSRPKAQINHDIALLRLADEVTFTDYIKPICLPSSDMVLGENENLVVTGWGQTENGQSSFVKRKTTIPVANRDSCLQKYQSDKKLAVGDGEICVGGVEGKDSCLGDSGGPLMLSLQRDEAAIWLLMGVVSFGSAQPCGLQDYPGLYTYLPKYIDWIYTSVQP